MPRSSERRPRADLPTRGVVYGAAASALLWAALLAVILLLR
jgi:hypothetical protein